ncbi:LptA/OstA family protein [Dongia rigui]|uniref:LptA/OstA family protein n=1 Tax=Dongia rigui TaxID=940149 RepID=A0ABU5DYC8_9PROT|nr:LptA/OstA family protein [Dongia rigui]MDY0872280.1 LptA/OstA family protein [Dongia rigui]
MKRLAMNDAPHARLKTALMAKARLLGAAVLLPTVLAATSVAAQEATTDVAQDASAAAPVSASGGMDFGDDTQPFELGADQGIEWRSKEKTYTARGNAVAKQGNSSIGADTLVFYTGSDDSSFDRILATGSVKVTSGSSVGYGDKGDYNATEKLLLLTGSNLKITSDNDVVTARDRIEYWTGRNAITAIGNAVVVREDTRIHGDKATLYFANDAEGKSKLSQIEADGKVKVLNNGQTIYANHFAYNPDTDIALMTGDVRIVDGQNEYRGQRAEIDNKRKISRILGGGERVHTFIKPKKNAASTATP